MFFFTISQKDIILLLHFLQISEKAFSPEELLTFSKTVEDRASCDDDGEGAEDEGQDESDVGVDRRVLGYEAIDVEARYRRAAVRLQRRDLVLGHRRAGVVVRPDAHLVVRAGLQFAQRVRLLNLQIRIML